MDLIEIEKAERKQFKRHPWETARARILLFLLERFVSERKNIYDIGSGDAFVVSVLSNQLPDCRIVASDINYSASFLDKMNNTLPNVIFTKNFNDIPMSDTVNAVLLMDVLEHTEKPGELLDSIKKSNNISGSTTFIITLPAFQFLFSEHDTILGHYRRYTRKEIVELVKKHGFTVRKSGYFFTSLFFFRMLHKIFGSTQKNAIHNWNGNKFLSALFKSFLWIDFKISWYLSKLGIHLPGLSCYCLCNRLP